MYYTYKGGSATNQTTSLISRLNYKFDESTNYILNYTYDAWGRLLSVKNASGSTISDASHIANVNPIRYRGYFYDTETKLYYCNSRYYDPQIKRFINADEVVSTGQGFIGYNMFAYCGNNPVVRIDTMGNDWTYILDVVQKMQNFKINPFIDNLFSYNRGGNPLLGDLIVKEIGKFVLDKMDCDLARWMFDYAFGNDGSQLEYDNLPPMLESKLIASSSLATQLGKYIAGAEQTRINWFDTQDQSIEFVGSDEKDLFYAIQKAEYRAWGWIENGNWKINIFVWDDYDFDNIRTGGSFFSDSANNLGFYFQSVESIVPYHWWIRYEYFYK